MEHVWAPWRIEYILSDKPEGCILCDKPGENKDKINFILYRGERNFVVMNLYPYNPGHLMVAPYRHIDSFEELDDEELQELFNLVRRSTRVLKETFKPAGFNIGINLGRTAGAGIDDHIHAHIVPRWNGDTNFMPAIAATRVIPEALAATYEKLLGKI